MSRFPKTTRTAALMFVGLFLCGGRGYADEIRVMTSGAFTAALIELTPAFERTTRHRIVIGATTSTGPDSIQNRLQRGEPVDVLIMAEGALDGFIRDGRVVPGSRVDLARSGIGAAVRAGAPTPDVSTVEAFKQTLLQAKSIAYSASVSGVYLSTELFQRLGIADEVLPKSRRIEGERVGAVVARGDAEIGFQQVSELLPVPGIALLGPLPQAIQRMTMFSAGVAANASSRDLARTLITFLASPAAAAAIQKTGMEPVTPAASIGEVARATSRSRAHAPRRAALIR
jgi:molybdate transport system substrate-binding protein